MTFEEFMFEVDEAILSIAGVSHHDLGDWLYYEAWESEQDPHNVALEVLEDNGFGEAFE